MFVYTIQLVIKPLSNRLSNWFNNRLYRVYRHSTGCQTRLTTGLTNAVSCIQLVVKQVVQRGLTTGWMNSCSFNTVVKPVVKPVWQPFDNRLDVCLHDTAVVNPVVEPVWQPAVSCKRGFKVCRSYSRKADFEQIHITLSCICMTAYKLWTKRNDNKLTLIMIAKHQHAGRLIAWVHRTTHLRNDATTLRPLSGITGRKLSTSWQPLQGPSLLSHAYSDLNALNWTTQQPRRSVKARNAFTIAYRTCERSFDMQFIFVHNTTIGIYALIVLHSTSSYR